MSTSLMLKANDIENSKVECFFELDEQLMELVSGGVVTPIKCESGQYGVTYHCPPGDGCGPAVVDCV